MARSRRSGSSKASSKGGRYQWYQAHVDAASVAHNAKIGVDILSGMDSDLQRGAVLRRIVGSWAARVDNDDVDEPPG